MRRGHKQQKLNLNYQFLVIMECKFDVFSLNAAGVGDSFKRRKVFNYLKKFCSPKGVIFLQETHSVKKNEKCGITSGDVGKI